LPKNKEKINFLIVIGKEIYNNKTKETSYVTQKYISNHINEKLDYFKIKLDH
jgi:hypothetical protein